MKKILASIIGLAALLGIGCSDSGSAGNARVMELYSLAAMTAQTGQVSFTYNQQSSSQQSRSMALYSIGGPANAPAASAVVVTIQNAAGATVYNARSLHLVDMNGSYITQPIDLVVGQYRLTQFIVVDSEGHALYATPVEGSPLAGFNLVDDPLPINFTVALNQTSKLIPQVLSVEEYTPDQFGYETLSFDIVDVINFQAGIMVYNAGSGNYELTGAAITISTGGTQLYSGSLQAATNSLAVKDGYASYSIRVTKAGYAAYTRTLTNAELKTYGDQPLVIQLSPAPPPQTALQWTWMSGNNSAGQMGVYGSLGVRNTANRPGARELCVAWVDSSGAEWVFGGDGCAETSSGKLNDLWRYEPSTGIWTWMSGDKALSQPGVYGTKGIGDTANKPGARSGSVSWVDHSGNFWLFGGQGYGESASDLGVLNDLWRYEPSTGIWTWISGDKIVNQQGVHGTKGIADVANKPGGRCKSTSWIDPSGNLWLFGGEVSGPSRYNDLWRYNPATGIWIWMSGDIAPMQSGVYGTKGVASPTNKPGGRSGAIAWVDSSGTAWLFGGWGFAESDGGYLNDLWRYQTSTGGQWTWMSGDKTANLDGVYGTKGVRDAANKPGNRGFSVSWIDSTGNLWLYGGNGFQSIDCYLSDLWRYEPSTGIWTWMSGDNSTNQSGVYGTKGVGNDNNKPGARARGVSWIDSSGNLYLFGGYNINGRFNDIWKIHP